jgi:hypothetical protein
MTDSERLEWIARHMSHIEHPLGWVRMVRDSEGGWIARQRGMGSRVFGDFRAAIDWLAQGDTQ